MTVSGTRRIYDFFFNIDMSMKRYILRSAVVSLVPSLLIGVLLAVVGLLDEEGPTDSPTGDAGAILFALVIFAPIAETILMAAGLWVLSFATRRPLRLAAISSFIWAGFHSILFPAWGVAVLWPFFVFNCAYLAWRKRSWWRAMFAAISIHALQNLLPGLLAAFVP